MSTLFDLTHACTLNTIEEMDSSLVLLSFTTLQYVNGLVNTSYIAYVQMHT